MSETKTKDTKDLVIRLQPDTWRKAKIHSVDTGESMNALINRLLEEYLDKTSEK